MKTVGKQFSGPVSSGYENNRVDEPEIKIEWEYDPVIFGDYDGAPVIRNMNGKSGVELFAEIIRDGMLLSFLHVITRVHR